MSDTKPYGSSGKALQPEPRIIDTRAATAEQALANSQAVIDATAKEPK